MPLPCICLFFICFGCVRLVRRTLVSGCAGVFSHTLVFWTLTHLVFFHHINFFPRNNKHKNSAIVAQRRNGKLSIPSTTARERSEKTNDAVRNRSPPGITANAEKKAIPLHTTYHINFFFPQHTTRSASEIISLVSFFFVVVILSRKCSVLWACPPACLLYSKTTVVIYLFVFCFVFCFLFCPL